MPSPGYRATLILKKILEYHPDGKRKFPYKFQLSLRGETGREQAECDFEPFPIYKIYGKQLKMADFSIIGQICQFQ